MRKVDAAIVRGFLERELADREEAVGKTRVLSRKYDLAVGCSEDAEEALAAFDRIFGKTCSVQRKCLMIARMQLSDLHLGDPRSTLSNPEVAAQATDELAEVSGGEVTKLVLAGDVHEECVPGDVSNLSEGVALSVRRASDSFFVPLFKKVKVGELVLVPGNHDLSTWQWFCMYHHLPTITSYTGDATFLTKWPWNILYPSATCPFTVAYPLYWDKAPGPDWPMLVTTHGHLLDPLVLGWDSELSYKALACFGCSRPNISKTSTEVKSLKQVAGQTLKFCLDLWKRYSPRDYAYSNYVMRRLLHPQSCSYQSWRPPANISSSIQSDAPSPGEGYIANVPWLLEVLLLDPELPSPVGSLRQDQREETFTKRSCITFGHDHLGTFKDVVACGVPFVAADSGGWTSEYDGHLPHTHVLVWKESGQVVPEPYFIRARTSSGGLL